MTGIYIFGGLLLICLSVYYFQNKKEEDSTYSKIKSRLEDDLNKAKFLKDWEKIQELNLYLMWLKTLYEVENTDILGNQRTGDEQTLFSTLTFDDIKFPLYWNLNDLYCYPFSQKIISAYGEALSKNEYKGIFKPDSILPVPKNYIRKAILFTFDYMNLEKPLYKIRDKDAYAAHLNGVNYYLDCTFIDTGNIKLPKTSMENYDVGSNIKSSIEEHDQVKDLNLIDWRTDDDWLVRGVRYADEESFDYAFACFDNAKKINPKNKDLNLIVSLAYFCKGEIHFESGEKELAFENMEKAAELKNEKATEWLIEHSEN